MDELFRRFMQAFNEVEQSLRVMTGADKSVGIQSLIDEVRLNQIRPAIQFVNDLDQYRVLRNAITHRYRNRRPVATPLASVVEHLESISALFAAPSKLTPHFVRRVQTCLTTESAAEAIARMREGDFTQLPVVDPESNNVVEVLSTQTIVRWLATVGLQDGGVLLSDHLVEGICEHRDSMSEFIIQHKESTADSTLEVFDAVAASGRYLEAVLVSNVSLGKGRQINADDVVGIITVADMPALLELTRV